MASPASLYKDKVKYLRTLGLAPKIDLRRIKGISPKQKGEITRRFNKTSEKYELYARKAGNDKLYDFVKTTDKDALAVAIAIWGEKSVVSGGSLSGFFSPKKRFSTPDERSSKPKVIKLGGVTGIQRQVGLQTERWFPAKLAGKSKKKISTIENRVERYIDTARKAYNKNPNVKFGFGVKDAVGRNMHNFEKFAQQFRKYIPAIHEQRLDIDAFIIYA